MLEISKSKQHIGSTFSSINPNIYRQFEIDKDAEIFDQVVFDLLLNKYSDDAELSDYILALPNNKQRMALLALIDGNNVLWSKMNSYVNECSDKFEHIKDVIKIMSKFVKDGEVERKKFGEVMTPISLVKEMLDTLPKEVWSNPNLKWFDPANGAGTFPYVVIYMLMKGLSQWQPDVEKRYKHIVENMIYTCELQSRNVFLWLCGVDPKNEYETKSYWGSFLDEGFDYHMKNVWNVEKFDIIIGNPPYQDVNENGGAQPKNHNLWSKFIMKSTDMTKGYLLFVTPDSWRSPSSKIFQLFKSNDLIFANFDTAKFFPGVGSTFSYWLLKIGTYSGNTVISGVSMDMNKVFYIPNGDKHSTPIHLKTIMESNEKFDVMCDTTSNHSSSKKSNLSKTQTEEKTYKMYHTNAQSFFSNTKSKNHDDKKVLFTISGYFNPIYDCGETSTSEICLYILVDDDISGARLLNILNSKLYKFLINTGKWSGFLNKDIIRKLPKLDTSRDWTDAEIYEYFNLSEEEIKSIENF